MDSLSVLVVDDSLITIKKLCTYLAELGHKVINTASTGREAVAAYANDKPDLVTMDITMPGMDGIEAARQILSRFPDAIVIMVTSHGQEAMVMNAIKAGARGYILKPIDKERLRHVIDQAFKKSR